MIAGNTTPDLAGKATSAIRRLLLDGTLAVGTPLKEVELAERLGMSRTPVREALARLEGSAIVERLGRSYAVAELDAADELDILQVRSALEPLAAGLAARRVGAGLVAPVQLAVLERAVAALRAAGRAGDAHAAVHANHEFHAQVVELAGNQVLASTLGSLNDRMTIATLARLTSSDWAEVAADQHGAISMAIAAGDVEAAEAAARAHVGAIGAHADRAVADPGAG